jgi:hypothetical protein
MTVTISERTSREQRSIERDLGAMKVWHRELEDDLIGSPTNPDRIERAPSRPVHGRPHTVGIA